MFKKILFSSVVLFSTINSYASIDIAKQNLKQNYPSTTFDEVNETPVTGIYEVVMGNNVAYTDKQARYFFFGNLFDMQTQTDITKTVQPKAFFPDEHLKNSIKEVKGNGSRKLAVFTDVDCPYCQQLEHTLTKLDNVTIYRFLFPLDSIHPQAKSVSINIWCSKDRLKAYYDYINHNISPKLNSCKNPIEENLILGGELGVQGTPSMIFSDGVVWAGSRPLEDIEEQFLRVIERVKYEK